MSERTEREGIKKVWKRVDEREGGGGRETKRMGERMKTMSKKRAGQNEKRKRKLILLSHFCKEPPGVCVFAGQTAVVVRKPSVRNFN